MTITWSAYPGVSGHFFGNAPLTAAEPWSGHYAVHDSLWTFAHWHHFADSSSGRWRYLPVRNDSLAANGTQQQGGAGFLREGGSYVTLVPSAAGQGRGHASAAAIAYPPHAFTLIIETLLVSSVNGPARPTFAPQGRHNGTTCWSRRKMNYNSLTVSSHT